MMEPCKACIYLVVDQCHRNPPQQLKLNDLAVYPKVDIVVPGCGERMTAEELSELEKESSVPMQTDVRKKVNDARRNRLNR